jgi:hypothetical protein
MGQVLLVHLRMVRHFGDRQGPSSGQCLNFFSLLATPSLPAFAGSACNYASHLPDCKASANKILQDNHDDYCSSCGAAGELVCCENCSRSFHLECVDMEQSGTLPDEWYCSLCTANRFPGSVLEIGGVFGNFINSLEKTNNKAYSLPGKIQGYFEGVKKGPEGVYEDVIIQKPSK